MNRPNRRLRQPSNTPAAAGGAIYFMVGNREGGPFSWLWRIGSGGTSFYVKPAWERFAEIKVSLHGPDPRHDSPHFRLDIDRQATEKVEALGGVFRHEWDLPLRFPGVLVDDGARHVARIRNAWDLFQSKDQSAPVHQSLRQRNLYLVVEAPKPPWTMDLDIFVSDRRPYWPHAEAVARDNAGLGPLQNHADQYLTAVVNHRTTLRHPTPARAFLSKGSGSGIYRRGFGSVVDESGFLWIVEQMMEVPEE